MRRRQFFKSALALVAGGPRIAQAMANRPVIDSCGSLDRASITPWNKAFVESMFWGAPLPKGIPEAQKTFVLEYMETRFSKDLRRLQKLHVEH